MQVISRARIDEALAGLDILPLIEAGFVAYSEGRAVVPPVGELVLDTGEVHIKYGFIKGDAYYVIKIASGHGGNPARGLPSGNGMMLVFEQDTGVPAAVLHDECHLTNVRTAAAGAIGARLLAPSEVKSIGILGTGVQARMQLELLAGVTSCRSARVWGRTPASVDRYLADMSESGFEITPADSPADVARTCELIVTTTPSCEPLLRAEDIRPGTHINAIGSDTPDKQELAAEVLARADRVVADSFPQSELRGEIARAVEQGAIERTHLVELGPVLAATAPGRTSDDQITVFDSTGVAVQDIQIATAVLGKVLE